MGLFKTAPDAPADSAEEQAPPRKASGPPTRHEIVALKRILALAVMAVSDALANPNTAGNAPRARLEKIASAGDLFGLSTLEVKELRHFLDAIDEAAASQSRLEFREAQRRSAPPTFDSFKPPSWRG